MIWSRLRSWEGKDLKIGEGVEPLLEKGLLPFPKPHPLPPKTFVTVDGVKGGVKAEPWQASPGGK